MKKEYVKIQEKINDMKSERDICLSEGFVTEARALTIKIRHTTTMLMAFKILDKQERQA